MFLCAGPAREGLLANERDSDDKTCHYECVDGGYVMIQEQSVGVSVVVRNW